MEFDWNNPPFNLDNSLTLRDIEESFEDPFAVRLLPSSSRFSVQARYFNLGVSASGTGIVSIYRANGKTFRVVHARPFEPEEMFFYQRKVDQTHGQTVIHFPIGMRCRCLIASRPSRPFGWRTARTFSSWN